MFRNKFTLILVAVLIILAGRVTAGDYDQIQFYGGGEISFLNRTQYNNGQTTTLNAFKTSNGDSKLAIQKNEPGVNVFLGSRFSEYFGGEVGFGLIQKASANVQNGQVASNKISNLYADFLGYLNIAEDIDLMGSVGVGSLKSHASAGPTVQNLNSITGTRVSYRFGGGVQYYFYEDWASRFVIRYQRGNPNFLKGLVSFSIGILYTFF